MGTFLLIPLCYQFDCIVICWNTIIELATKSFATLAVPLSRSSVLVRRVSIAVMVFF